MKAITGRSQISGRVKAPTSKSAIQRYIAGALLAEGVSKITASSLCDDSLAAMSIAQALGALISVSGEEISIIGGFKPVSTDIFCGESGLSARMFTPIAALHNKEIILNGRGSLLNRPLDMVERPLAELGAEVTSNKGFLPLRIRGPLKGGEVTADGSVSSQFITGLLMALPLAQSDSKIFVENLVSRPYIDLTISILGEFGIIIENDNYRIFTVRGSQKFRSGSFKAEGDWSGAAFLMVAGAIGGHIAVTGLLTSSTQADKAVIEALSRAGAEIIINGEAIHVSGDDLKGFEFDISNCPDLAPPLTVLAMGCKGRSVLLGAERLAAKESDRGRTLEESMIAIGGRVKHHGKYLEINGGKILEGGVADSHNDHRIAMALAVASLLCDSTITINGIECINKSYPGFIDDFNNVGGSIKRI